MANEQHMTTVEQILADIAKKHCGFETLEERRSGDLDFGEVAVWMMKAALFASYRAGRRQGRVDQVEDPKCELMVPSDKGCPQCGEMCQDALLVNNDGEVECQHCGFGYLL